MVITGGCGFTDADDNNDNVVDDNVVDDNGECQGDECLPSIELALRPDTSSATHTRVAWYPVEDAEYYELVMTERGEDGEPTSELFRQETTGLHGQIPKEYRDTPSAYLQVKAYGGDGEEAIGESDVIRFDCEECGSFKAMNCYQICDAPSFAYSINIRSDANTYANAFAEITGAGTYIPYSSSDYWERYDNDISFRNRPMYTQNVNLSSDPVYDRFCSYQLTGTVYFARSDAGVYQPAVDAEMTTSTFANDGQSMCGTFTTMEGMNMLFTQNSSISPPLHCPAQCGPAGGGGHTPTNWSYQILDQGDFPDLITIADGILDPSAPGGWFDDGSVRPILEALAEHAFDETDDGGNETEQPPRLKGLSLRAAVPEVRDLRGERERQTRVHIDLKRLEEEGADYVEEITDNLDPDLYILVRYYGGRLLRPMALIHPEDS